MEVDDGASVSSHGSRRSARIAERKRKAEESEEEPTSPFLTTPRPQKKLKAGSAIRRPSTDLKAIPEEINTASDAVPPPKPPVLPPITPAKLQVAVPETPAAAIPRPSAIDPTSSKKLMALDHKVDTPFKRASAEQVDVPPTEEHTEDLPKQEASVSTVEAPAPVDEAVPTLATVWRNQSRTMLLHHGHHLETKRFWILFFFVLQIVFYPITLRPLLSTAGSLSRVYLNMYKSFLPQPVDRTPVLLALQEELAELHELEKQGIRVLKRKTAELKDRVQAYVSTSDAEIRKLHAMDITTNLSAPKLWSMDRECAPDTDGAERISIAAATEQIREAYDAKIKTLQEETDVEGWIGQHLPKQLIDRNEVRLQRLIAEQIEHDRADFDYTDKVLASTGNFVDQLPWANRLMAMWGLRFYGNGPEAAIVPTTPRSAVGHCWALVPPATATIELSSRIYVQSISIEHPSQARPDSAIRTFSLVGVDADLRSWPLGSFAYDNKERRQDYMVRDEYKDEEIPPLLVVKLIIDSSWGDDYACLYRFRVFGEVEEGDDVEEDDDEEDDDEEDDDD